MNSGTGAFDVLEAPRIEAYLSENIEGFQGPIEFEVFEAGQSNPTFLITTPDKKYVLRKKPEGDLLKSAHAVDREYRVQKALWDTEVPVVRMLHLCEDQSVLGTAFYVMEYAEGRIFWDPALPELASDERQEVYAEMARVLAEIHSVDLQTSRLESFGRADGYYSRQLKLWTTQYEASRTENLPEMDGLRCWLEENLPSDSGKVSLVHGDYRIDNLMFAPDSLKIIAVFDWELSTLGDPLADLAYQIMQRAMGRDWYLRGLEGLDTDALGIPSELQYVEAYCGSRGIKEIEHWNFARAFAFYRFAAICQGVKRRGLDGNAASPDAARVGAMAAPLARLGYRLVH